MYFLLTVRPCQTILWPGDWRSQLVILRHPQQLRARNSLSPIGPISPMRPIRPISIQRRLNRLDHFRRLRLDRRLEALDDLAVAVDQEFPEVPLDLARERRGAGR